jgi:hypothetical protein
VRRLERAKADALLAGADLGIEVAAWLLGRGSRRRSDGGEASCRRRRSGETWEAEVERHAGG